MSIVQTNVPITAESCQEMILQITRTYPFCRSELLATTAFQRPIRTLVIGNGPRKVIYTAAHHANEWITALILLKFAEELAEAIREGGKVYGVDARTIVDAATIYMVPLVDPDGVDLVVGAIEPGQIQYETARALADNYPTIPFPEGWKANLLGVDLNLQYPAGWLQAREIKFSQGFIRPGPRDYVGRAPLGQIESRALAGYTEAIDPELVLAYHTQGEVIYWQFRDYEVPGAQELAEDFARTSGYRAEEVPFESSFAGYKDWFIQRFRRPGFTIEVGQGENPLPLEQFAEIYRRNLGILTTGALGLPSKEPQS
jgi:g-D-glutamyl-meso-diaminopimelate peptidase